jgi:hypothetical protein
MKRLLIATTALCALSFPALAVERMQCSVRILNKAGETAYCTIRWMTAEQLTDCDCGVVPVVTEPSGSDIMVPKFTPRPPDETPPDDDDEPEDPDDDTDPPDDDDEGDPPDDEDDDEGDPPCEEDPDDEDPPDGEDDEDDPKDNNGHGNGDEGDCQGRGCNDPDNPSGSKPKKDKKD